MDYIVYNIDDDSIIAHVHSKHPLTGKCIHPQVGEPGVAVLLPEVWEEGMKVRQGRTVRPAGRAPISADDEPPQTIIGEAVRIPAKQPNDPLEFRFSAPLARIPEPAEVLVEPNVKIRIEPAKTGFIIRPVDVWPRGVQCRIVSSGLGAADGTPAAIPATTFEVRRTYEDEKAYQRDRHRKASIAHLESRIPQYMQINAGNGIYDEATRTWIRHAVESYRAAMAEYSTALDKITAANFDEESRERAYDAVVALRPRWPEVPERPTGESN